MSFKPRMEDTVGQVDNRSSCHRMRTETRCMMQPTDTEHGENGELTSCGGIETHFVHNQNTFTCSIEINSYGHKFIKLQASFLVKSFRSFKVR